MQVEEPAEIKFTDCATGYAYLFTLEIGNIFNAPDFPADKKY